MGDLAREVGSDNCLNAKGTISQLVMGKAVKVETGQDEMDDETREVVMANAAKVATGDGYRSESGDGIGCWDE